LRRRFLAPNTSKFLQTTLAANNNKNVNYSSFVYDRYVGVKVILKYSKELVVSSPRGTRG
jgi:hypothetical protein